MEPTIHSTSINTPPASRAASDPKNITTNPYFKATTPADFSSESDSDTDPDSEEGAHSNVVNQGIEYTIDRYQCKATAAPDLRPRSVNISSTNRKSIFKVQ